MQKMKLFLFLLVLILAEEALSTHLETCECHEIQKLVNETVQEAIAGLESRINNLIRSDTAGLKNQLRQVNSSVQDTVAGLERRMSNLIRSSINNSENRALDTLEVKLITTMETLIQPIQNQLNYHLPPPLPLNNSKNNPTTSCKALYEKYPEAPSGYYWISHPNGSAVRVYCSMKDTCGDKSGGWMRVVNLDMSNTSQSCPTGLTYVSSPKRLCKSTSSCASNILSTQGIQYNQVCGKIIGYQENFPPAFWDYQSPIDSAYVAGVSLTHGQSPRKHIWTFAAAPSETGAILTRRHCRCANNAAPVPPSYVGNDYFCDTAYHTRSGSGVNTANPLWDGKGCTTSSCCTFNSPPWFSKELSSPTTDDVEMRVCNYYSDGKSLIETVELYIQ